MHLSGTVMEIWHLKDNGVTTLTFWGHVTSSLTWPSDSWWATSYGWSIVAMHLSCTVMEIWHLKDNGVTTLTFWNHVTRHVTIRILWMVRCDHASIWHRYGDMKPQMLDRRSHGWTDRRSGDFILCPMLCIAFDRQKGIEKTKISVKVPLQFVPIYNSKGQRPSLLYQTLITSRNDASRINMVCTVAI